MWHSAYEQEKRGLDEKEQAKFNDDNYARTMKLAWLLGPLNIFGIVKTTNPKMNRARQFLANLTAKQRTRYMEEHPLWTHNIQLNGNPEAMRKAIEELRQ